MRPTRRCGTAHAPARRHRRNCVSPRRRLSPTPEQATCGGRCGRVGNRRAGPRRPARRRRADRCRRSAEGPPTIRAAMCRAAFGRASGAPARGNHITMRCARSPRVRARSGCADARRWSPRRPVPSRRPSPCALSSRVRVAHEDGPSRFRDGLRALLRRVVSFPFARRPDPANPQHRGLRWPGPNSVVGGTQRQDRGCCVDAEPAVVSSSDPAGLVRRMKAISRRRACRVIESGHLLDASAAAPSSARSTQDGMSLRMRGQTIAIASA